ncbi:MAG: GxxExxY protein [bacterium]
MEYPENLVTERIIQCIIKVHQTLGPGFLESIYRKAMVIELTKQDLTVETEKEVIIYYEGKEVGKHRLDILVGNKVIVELKTVEELSKAHYAQGKFISESYRYKSGYSCELRQRKGRFQES